jgi:hypothetical protein
VGGIGLTLRPWIGHRHRWTDGGANDGVNEPWDISRKQIVLGWTGSQIFDRRMNLSTIMGL